MNKSKMLLWICVLISCDIWAQTGQSPCDLSETAIQSKNCLLHVWNNPRSYPNYTAISAHRGYWKDEPENSIPAMTAAIDLGVDMVELDVMKTSDDSIFLLHDWHLDRLTNGTGTVRSTDANGNWVFHKTWNELKDVRLRHPIIRSQVTDVPLPLLRDALIAIKTHGKGKVLISVDKADQFMDEVYLIAKALDMTDVITWKTKIQLHDTPAKLKAKYAGTLTTSEQTELVSMYTPTIFGEYYEAYQNDLLNKMDDFITAGVTGFEMVYFKPTDGMLTTSFTRGAHTYNNVLDYLRARNTRVIQFPEWPETCQGNWSPPKQRFRDINVATDYRGNWDWLMSSGNPDLIITDRLEVFIEVLKLKSKRSLQSGN